MNFSKKNKEHSKVNENWVSKKVIIILIFLILPVLCWSQKATNFQSTIEKNGYIEVEWTYIHQMKVAAKALDNCSTKKNKCNLINPIKNNKTNLKEQISLGWSWGASQGVQKNMARFEKLLLKSKNFPKKQLEIAFRKYPGYSYSAMSSRMSFYIMSMESVEDDE